MQTALGTAREEAFVLHGLLRALRVVHEENGADARDGTTALIEVVVERAMRLAEGLERLDAIPSAPLAEVIAEGCARPPTIANMPSRIALSAPASRIDGRPVAA